MYLGCKGDIVDFGIERIYNQSELFDTLFHALWNWVYFLKN